MKHIYEALIKIQSELKVPKNQKNKFGGYNYRSCEDIMESVKPLLNKNDVVLVMSDDIVSVGMRYYVKSTAILSDGEDVISNSAFARESEIKKGMDDSQITGAASSYARKYALNGLFCIDDTKDADTDEYQKQQQEKDEKKLIGSKEKSILTKTRQKYNITDDEFYLIISSFGYNNIDEIQMKDYANIGNKLSEANK